ncbi:hypothetical protein VTN96DRAFT_1565 [Rasamsonia emersonii]
MSMATATASGAMASSSSMSGMGMGGSCKISMLWNWYTIDSCFITTHWHVTSHGMFAGSCIGVICLVMMLEFLRRLSKDYDRYLVRQFRRRTAAAASYARAQEVVCCRESPGNDNNDGNNAASTKDTSSPAPAAAAAPVLRFRPTLVQQSIRALLHMATFAVAYFIMLLAMYYNGYFIICIFIGAYLGAFVFTWESVSLAPTSAGAGTVGPEGVTVCCG